MKQVLTSVFLLLFASGTGAAESRDFSLDVPAGDVNRLELRAEVGEVTIRAADVDAVEIRVRLEPDEDWFGGDADLEARLEAAELRHDVSGGGALRVHLDYDRTDLGDSDLEEKWEIRLPARLAVKAELNVGQTEIEDVSGGVEAEVNVGQLTVEVPRGDVDARVNVGEVSVRNATPDPGKFELEVNIGDARLEIDGRDVGETAGWLGRSVRHEAEGDDDVSARVNVGEVRVSVR